MPQLYMAYTKKEFLISMQKNLPEDVVIVTSNVLEVAEVVKKKQSIKITQSHAQEFFKNSDGVNFIFQKTIPISMLICKPESISEEYTEKLKKDKGLTGFKIGQ